MSALELADGQEEPGQVDAVADEPAGDPDWIEDFVCVDFGRGVALRFPHTDEHVYVTAYRGIGAGGQVLAEIGLDTDGERPAVIEMGVEEAAQMAAALAAAVRWHRAQGHGLSGVRARAARAVRAACSALLGLPGREVRR